MSSGGREEGTCKVCGAWSSGVSYKFHGTCLAHAPRQEIRLGAPILCEKCGGKHPYGIPCPYPKPNKKLIDNVFKQVRRLFIWTCDKEQWQQPEHWKSYVDVVERGEVFRDDCDGFSLTCAELLHRRGINPSLIRLAACWTETGEYHAICVADEMVLDNRQRAVWHWSKLPYRWDKSMRMDEVGVWRKA